MTKSRSAALIGSQRPRVEWIAPGVPNPDAEATLELCEAVGFTLDPWQQYALRKSMLRDAETNKWAAMEVGLVLPRQNGKNAVLEARQLGGLFITGDNLQVHSAHLFDTSMEAFRRLLHWVENTPWLDSKKKRKSLSHGAEGIELKDGRRIRFRTRTKGGGRGFTADTLYLDEAMILALAAHGSLFPTLSARPDPQIWYTGSAVDRLIHDDGLVLSRLRTRGARGGDPRLTWLEWSVDWDDPATVPPELAMEIEQWATANPGMNLRIMEDYIAAEYRGMGGSEHIVGREFAVERLGIGDWFTEDEDAVVDLDLWDSLCDTKSGDRLQNNTLTFAYDVSPDRAHGTISVAGRRYDGLRHVEIAAQDRGAGWITGWFPERIAGRYRGAKVITDSRGPGASLIPELERRGVKVTTVDAAEYAKACGDFVDTVTEARLRHTGQAPLRAALRGAITRPLGDGAWAWSRKSSGVNITPLVSATLATWGAAEEKKVYRRGGFA